jgi:DNA modification methylase
MARIAKQQLEMVSVNDLKVHPDNPRKGNVAAIKESITTNDFYGAVVAQKSTGFVLVGNHRLIAARESGIAEVPTFWLDCDDDRARRILLADNRANDLATYDDEALGKLLRDLAATEGGLLGTLYDEEAFKALCSAGGGGGNSAEDPGAQVDKADELRAKWGTERGQLWLIGEHRLLCGDSTSAPDVHRLMAGRRAKLFATDPPWLVDYDGENRPWAFGRNAKAPRGAKTTKYRNDEGGTITWDTTADWARLYDEYNAVARDIALDKHAAWYCWYAAWNHAMVEFFWEKNQAYMHQQIVWVKPSGAFSRMWYSSRHELCMFGWVRPNKPVHPRENVLTSVWEFPNRGDGHDDVEHPTVKAVQCFTIPMEQHTKPGDICYEPFSGSGTQIVAAEQTGRVCYAMEIEPKYVAVAWSAWLAWG